MAKISGVPVENISKIAGKEAASLNKIGTISKSNIPGWPSAASCTPDLYAYGRDTAAACGGTFQFFDYDDSTGMLYVSGQCGTTLAPVGYYQWYTDNMLYYFNQVTPLRFYGACGGK